MIEENQARNKPVKKKLHKGGRNLVILGVVSTIIALATTGVSLAIYHNSGDIYLDRSRPGFLPDEEEAEEDAKQEEEEYDFSKTGALSAAILQEYLEKLQVEVQAIDAYEEPFGSKILSDEELDIVVPEDEKKVEE